MPIQYIRILTFLISIGLLISSCYKTEFKELSNCNPIIKYNNDSSLQFLFIYSPNGILNGYSYRVLKNFGNSFINNNFLISTTINLQSDTFSVNTLNSSKLYYINKDSIVSRNTRKEKYKVVDGFILNGEFINSKKRDSFFYENDLLKKVKLYLNEQDFVEYLFDYYDFEFMDNFFTHKYGNTGYNFYEFLLIQKSLHKYLNSKLKANAYKQVIMKYYEGEILIEESKLKFEYEKNSRGLIHKKIIKTSDNLVEKFADTFTYKYTCDF
jgi:hypothetical protein